MPDWVKQVPPAQVENADIVLLLDGDLGPSAEQGTPSEHYCTSRREACVAVSSTVTDASPFWYVSTDAYTRASCAMSCPCKS